MGVLGGIEERSLSYFRVTKKVICYHEPGTWTEMIEGGLEDGALRFHSTTHQFCYLTFTPAKGGCHVTTSLDCFEE